MSGHPVDVLSRERVLPVLVLDDPAHAGPLGDALARGGIGTAEVTLRTPAALAAIERLAADPRLIVGAGSVVTPDQVDAAVAAGARFVVSPGLSGAVVRRCAGHGVPAVPGVATATEVMRALDLGVTLLKFFPAAAAGGPGAVAALGGPFPRVAFIPTGGIGELDAADYLALPNVAAVGGTWLAPAALLRDGDYDAVAARAGRARILGSEVRR